jgi:hypothetical protein
MAGGVNLCLPVDAGNERETARFPVVTGSEQRAGKCLTGPRQPSILGERQDRPWFVRSIAASAEANSWE